MIPKGYKDNFKTLVRAAKNGDLALLEVRERATGKIRYATCAMERSNEDVLIVPFALMIDGNPYELLDAPDPDGGFLSK